MSRRANDLLKFFSPQLGWLTLLLSFGAGLYGWHLDNQQRLLASELHLVFLVLSVVASTLVTWLSIWQVRNRAAWILAPLAALLAWRISFFPLLVLAGSLTSWVEWTSISLVGDAAIYVVFLPSFIAMYVLAIHVAASLSVRSATRQWPVIVPVLCLSSVAGVVSFIAPEDQKWGLVSEPISARSALTSSFPQGNPYGEILKSNSLNWRQRTLMHIGSFTYASLPSQGAPWAIRVKGTLEQSIRAATHYSSETLLVDHYHAFSAAHNPKQRL